MTAVATSAAAARTSIGPAVYDRMPRLLLLAWGALLVNVLTFAANDMIFPIPQPVGQAIAQGSLAVALVLVLLANRSVVLRPSLFLVLLSMLAIVSLMVSIHNEFLLGSTFRAMRFVGFVTVLWLLTPWFGRRDMILLRCHRWWLWFVLGSVVLGFAISPGVALGPEGRLRGVIWPIPPTQVGHYAAVLFGTSIILWMCRVVPGKQLALSVVVSVPVLLLTHTRTALLACLVGLVLAGASLFLGHIRVRRTWAGSVIVMVPLVTIFLPEIMNWVRRGQNAQEAAQLTGRTKVWSAVFATPRDRLTEMFGTGQSNQSFNGLPIDSNWVASYVDEGWFGIVVQGCFLLVLVLMAASHVRGPRRAIALFLIAYCIVASVTETGLNSPSPYLLDLAVAAALVAR